MGDAGRIGPYVLRGELGRGAMARVWRAWDPNLEREVAIKEPLFDPRLSETVLAEMGRRFVAEGCTAARLNHPNIVQINAADVWDGRPAIVMELVEGYTLTALIAGGPLAPASSLAILDQLLDAVGYAHDRGIVHRDIKPDNIFVTHDGTVKLADFGVAHVEDSAASVMTMAGSVLGTPGYMSPEQALGRSVDARSDLFSVGVVAYEMLTGRNPFGVGTTGDATTLIYRVVHEQAPELPQAACAGLPADIRPAIMAALEKDPKQRPSSAYALKTMLHGAPSTGVVETDSWNTRVVEPGMGAAERRRRTWVPVAIAGVVALGAIVFVLTSALSGNVGRGSSGVAAVDVVGVAGSVSHADVEADGEEEQEAASPIGSAFYVAASNGSVAIFSNSSASPIEVSDVDVVDLDADAAELLNAHIVADSIEDAKAVVESLRQEASVARAQREAAEERARVEADAKANPPVFTTTEASSTLPPDQVTSYYGPNNAVDGDFMTAWNEGVEGNGVGEWISLGSSSPQWVRGVRIVTGYPKTDSVYYKNHRVRDCTIELSDGYSIRATLADLYREYQEVDFGDYHQTTYIRVTIDSVYGGSKWDDASICEIQPY